MPFCPQCGTSVESLGRPCVQCGAGTAPPQPAEHRLQFHGSGGTLLKIYLVTFLLSLVTLGVYYFWGKARIRKYLASSIDLDGDRFQFHGTGGELIRGFVVAVLVFGTLFGQLFLWQFLFPENPKAEAAGIAVLYIALLFLIPVSVVGSWRYRLSRTSWREIRFGFDGKRGEFLKIFVGGFILTMLTLTLYSPIWATNMHRFLVANSRFGTARFGFDGEGKDLFKTYAIALLLAVPTLTLSLYWYQIRQANYFFNHTTIGDARFRLQIRTPEFFGVFLGSYVLIFFTLGIGFPWAQCMMLKFFTDRLSLHGELPYAEQKLSPASATGEELSDVLDADGIDLSLGL